LAGMMPTCLERSFPATATGMHAALEAIDQFCTASKIDAVLLARVRIAVEELFSNTIKYGYGEECERPVRLRLDSAPAVTLTYEDDAAPFDPTLWRPAERAEGSTDGSSVGRKGIMLILGLSSTAHYLPRPMGNCLEITFETAAAKSRHGG
jgi:anti-sigma regulatory factor (Ser/Thr protein kinase)